MTTAYVLMTEADALYNLDGCARAVADAEEGLKALCAEVEQAQRAELGARQRLADGVPTALAEIRAAKATYRSLVGRRARQIRLVKDRQRQHAHAVQLLKRVRKGEELRLKNEAQYISPARQAELNAWSPPAYRQKKLPDDPEARLARRREIGRKAQAASVAARMARKQARLIAADEARRGVEPMTEDEYANLREMLRRLRTRSLAHVLPTQHRTFEDRVLAQVSEDIRVAESLGVPLDEYVQWKRDRLSAVRREAQKKGVEVRKQRKAAGGVY